MRSAALILALLTFSAGAARALEPSAAVVKAADDFSHVADEANPWVVNINTTQYVRQRVSSFWQDFYGIDPFMGAGPTRTFKRQSLGSGFIYSADGLILTNAHVVEGADEILVRLMDGSEAKATVVGSDSNVDIALLKIDVKQPLPAAPLGDSSKVRVGEWAIAIGSPLGFDHTLTVGVISAKERTNIFTGEGAAKYQNYLQTDASINHGNSGGPLCNIRGEVIGMNTAISTPNDGSIGIGFAIPVNFIKRSIPDLQSSGRVMAPRLGFYTQDLDDALAKALKLPRTKGVLVSDVTSGGSAEKAGLKRGDVLLSFNGEDITNNPELRTRVYEADPGKPMDLVIWRDGKKTALTMVPEMLKASADQSWHGLEVEANDPATAQRLGLPVAEGVLVTRVAQGSSADRIGVRSGDVLLEVNRQRMRGLADWKKVVSSLDQGHDCVLLLVRGRQSAYVVLPAEQ